MNIAKDDKTILVASSEFRSVILLIKHKTYENVLIGLM